MKTLETLSDDIFDLFNPSKTHEVSEENLDAFCDNMKDLIRRRLQAQDDSSARPIRFSALGKPNRVVWYDAHPEPGSKEPMTPQTYLKFMYGDIIEQLLLLLVKEAGHTVEAEQGGVEVDGVTGSIDAKIDGVVVDVKSASSYGYQKFKDRRVTEDDPFGYVAQLSGYASVLTPGKDAAWLAMNKESGAICVSPLSSIVISHYKPEERINELKNVVASDEPPERCYSPVPDGKSGNMKLATACSYCAHKFRCYPKVRTFIYSSGPRYLTTVSRVPDVLEILNDYS